ncbi:hypothetical protein F5Y09DRAFT_322529 [Xylaria sp. FL1042]|nr:hypothetical protein F5Y09DRAFT_322529 [Xylaria sp. FL1042]
MPDQTPPLTPNQPQHPLLGAEPSGQNFSGQGQHRFPPTPETPPTVWKNPRVSHSSSLVNAGPFLTKDSSEDQRETDIDELQPPASLTASLGAKFLLGVLKVFNVATRRTRREREALSKSRVDNLIGLIRDIHNCIPQEGRSEVITRKLLPGDYKALLERLGSSDNDISGFFHEALRYEYRPSLISRAQFTIRMNSVFHEGMIADINRRVTGWLDHILKNERGEYTSKIVEIAGHLDPKGARTLQVGEKDLRSDCSYMYRPAIAELPALVVEVAWSQSTKKLRNKAKELIQESEGYIRTVVGFDFYGTYSTWDKIKEQWDRTGIPRRGPACVFVWRAVFDRKTGRVSLDDEGQPKITESTHVFCDEHGEANLDERVCLGLQDMIPERALREERIDRRGLRSVELVIDSTTLIHRFDRDLEDQKAYEDRKAGGDRKAREDQTMLEGEPGEAGNNAKKEKGVEGNSRIKNLFPRYSYKLRLTEARQRRKGT